MIFALTALALACFIMIISPRIQTGVVMTSGLTLILISCIAAVGDAPPHKVYRFIVGGNLLVMWSTIWNYMIKPRVIKSFERRGKPHPFHAEHVPFDRRGSNHGHESGNHARTR